MEVEVRVIQLALYLARDHGQSSEEWGYLLPSIEVLRAQLLGVIQAPATQLARVINTPASMVARAIQAHVDKGE